MARTQAPDIASPEALRVPGAVTDLYAPPPRPVADNNLADLANALSSFSTDIRRFAIVSGRQQSATERVAANNWTATHTNEDVKAAVHDGRLPVYADPVANDVIAKDYARRLGNEMTNGFNAQIGTGQLDLTDPNLDIDALVNEQAKNAAAQIAAVYPKSLPAASELATHVGAVRQALYAKRQEALVQQNVKTRLGVIDNTFNGIIASEGANGTLPDGSVPAEVGQAANEKIRAAYRELGKSLAIDGKTMPPAWMDQRLLSSLKNNAKTNPEIVFSILNAPRKDENGNPLPPLAANPRYSTEVRDILTSITPALAAKDDHIQKNHLVQGAIDALNRQDGSYWRIHDFAYTNRFSKQQKIISADEQRKAAMANYQTWSDSVSAARGETADTKFDREFNVYSHANVAMPGVKQTLEGVTASLTSPSAMSNPADREKLQQAGELYLHLSDKNYSYLKNTINLPAPAQNYYDVYEVARRYMGQNADQAADTAASAVSQRENATDLGVRMAQHKEIEQKVSSDFGNGILSWAGIGSGAGNLGTMRKRLGDIASVLVRVNGMSVDDAVNNAEKLLKGRSYIVNGHAVLDEGYLPPKEMQQYTDQALKDFFSRYGKENNVSSEGDLSITPYSNGKFWITKTDGPYPQKLYVKRDGKVVPAIISMSDLYRLRGQGTEATHQQIITDQKQNVEDSILYGNKSRLSPENRKLQQQMGGPRDKLIKSLQSVTGNTPPPSLPGQQNTESYSALPDAIRSLWKKITDAPFIY